MTALKPDEREQPATFRMDGWAGSSETPCMVIGETPKRYRVKLTQRCRLPGRMRWGYAGQVVLMPKAAVQIHCAVNMGISANDVALASDEDRS